MWQAAAEQAAARLKARFQQLKTTASIDVWPCHRATRKREKREREGERERKVNEKEKSDYNGHKSRNIAKIVALNKL